MRPFKILSHTSEIGIEVRGRDLSAIFQNAAAGLLAVFDKRGKVKTRTTVSIRMRSSSAEALLVHWLSELVFLVQTRHWLFGKIEFPRLQETSLSATLQGESMRRGVHRIGREIKAVTFHQLRIVRDKDALKATVLFDV